ncbi:hypothetical protein LTR53_017353 [Teratosphaeriaceae sp. CCFEE 6253]|nr:hypothetical protein LTR53_017353 [Teratosphaeriaceae sp. CCFEE 6253]
MATLMSLSNELLSKILRHTIPSNVIQSEYIADRCEQKDRHYRDWKSSTPVSRRYFLVARNAFFRAYTHRVRIMYPYPMSLGWDLHRPKCETALRQSEIKREIRNLHIYVQAPSLGSLEAVVEAIDQILIDCTGLNGVEIMVETSEREGCIVAVRARLCDFIQAWCDRAFGSEGTALPVAEAMTDFATSSGPLILENSRVYRTARLTFWSSGGRFDKGSSKSCDQSSQQRHQHFRGDGFGWPSDTSLGFECSGSWETWDGDHITG